MSDYDILRQALLIIRKTIRNSGIDYESDDIYNIAIDALNATEVCYKNNSINQYVPSKPKPKGIIITEGSKYYDTKGWRIYKGESVSDIIVKDYKERYEEVVEKYCILVEKYGDIADKYIDLKTEMMEEKQSRKYHA